jgi:hypothetical protein
MKNIVFFTLLVLGFIAVSCDREIEFPTTSVTDPALEVQVEGPLTNNAYPKIEGATVSLYSSDNTLLATGTTDSDGHVTFTKDQLKEKGVFTVTATKGALTNTATTPYLLLNDGVTLFIIQLQ